jgi:Holliday junction resolvase RusA-like endonuclease
MTRPVTITLLGEPVAFARTRISSRGFLFTPEPQRIAGAALRYEAQAAMAFIQAELFDEPLRIDLLAEVSIPSSWSQKKQGRAIRGELRPSKRPDLSNVLKLVEDSLNGIVYRDDALIVEVRARKTYSVQPKLVITVQPVSLSLRDAA